MRRLVALIRWVDFALGLIALDLGAGIIGDLEWVGGTGLWFEC